MPNEQGPQDENHVIAERRAKLKHLRERGHAYPNDFVRQQLAADLIERYDGHDRDALDVSPVQVQIAEKVRVEISRNAVVGYQGQEPVAPEPGQA